MTAVGVLGTGAMGSGVARNLAEAGHAVTVWNRTPVAAQVLAEQHDHIFVAASPRIVAAAVDLVIAIVSDDAASRQVWLDETDGALAGVGGDTIAIESSTVSPAWAVELGRQMTSRGRRFLEAPMVGSRPQVAARQVRYLVGGEQATLDAARPVLEANAIAITHLGGVGNAAAMKLAINGLLAVQVAALAEIIGLLERTTIDRATALGLIGELPIISPALQRVLGLLHSADLTPNFTIDLVAKDLGYLTRTAADLEARVPLAAVAHAVFTEAADHGFARRDIAAITGRYVDPSGGSASDAPYGR